jgi:predicted nucleic acid-binding protein
VIAIDSSVAVPALSAAHPDHALAHALVAAERPMLPTHAAVETYAVLTRLPAPVGLAADVAAEVVRDNFAGRTLELAPGAVAGLLGEFAAAGIVGGAVYDGLIAVIAREAAAVLVTNDRRARATYGRLGVQVRFLTEPQD